MKINFNWLKFIKKNSLTLLAFLDILLVLGLTSYFTWFVYNRIIKTKPLDEKAVAAKQIGIDEDLYIKVAEQLKSRQQNKIDPEFLGSINNPFLP